MVDKETVWQELGRVCFETLNNWAELSVETIAHETSIDFVRLDSLTYESSDNYGQYTRWEVNQLHALWDRTYKGRFLIEYMKR